MGRQRGSHWFRGRGEQEAKRAIVGPDPELFATGGWAPPTSAPTEVHERTMVLNAVIRPAAAAASWPPPSPHTAPALPPHGWGARGETELLAAQLSSLCTPQGGWGVLHSLPAGSDISIGRLVVGPPGAFTVISHRCQGARAELAGESLSVAGQWLPLVREARIQARRAQLRLSVACRVQVPVTAVVSLEVRDLVVRQSPPGVRVTLERHLAQCLTLCPPQLPPALVEAAWFAAGQRATWR